MSCRAKPSGNPTSARRKSGLVLQSPPTRTEILVRVGGLRAMSGGF
ncbi:hypothetical protein [Chamaesiphon polymorphus]|nr:hypothetical protein [Chamaesiphon polymorphus]